MNEPQVSKHITELLDWGASQIADSTMLRLRAARSAALQAHREPIRVLGLMTVSGRVLEPAYLLRQPLFWVPILAFAALVLAFNLQSSDDLYDDAGAIDAGILSSELPPDALLDRDFAEWVKESSARESAAGH